MKSNKFKMKKFLLPILSLVLISIVSISSYLITSKFKSHIENNKRKVHKEVNSINKLITFEISTIENKLKEYLREKVKIALHVATFTYNNYKNTLNKEEIYEF